MEFDQLEEIQKGDETTVKSGTCTQDGKRFKCIEKQYTNTKFDKVVAILERFESPISDLGPHIYHVDKDKKVVYMEYIECQTLKSFLSSLHLHNRRSSRDSIEHLSKVLAALSLFMTKLRDTHGVCHGDLHTENLLVCQDMTIKMVDIDDLEFIKDQRPGFCNDYNELGSTMFFDLTDHLVQKKQEALAKAREATNKVYQKELADLYEILDHTVGARS